MSKEEFEKVLAGIIKENPALTQEGIATSLGYNEGFISQMLSRNKISAKFVTALKQKFANSKPLDSDQNFQDKYISTIESRLKEMEEDKKFLQRIIEANLVTLADGQKIVQAQLRTIHQWDAIKDAESKAKTPKEIDPLIDKATEKIHRLLAANLQPVEAKGKKEPARI